MSTQPAPAIPRALFVFSIFYGGMVCIAGVLGAKQVKVGPLAVEAGIFGFILLVVIASTIAELYGRATADRLVRLGFIPLIVSMVLIQLVLVLPILAEALPSPWNTDVIKLLPGGAGQAMTAVRQTSDSLSAGPGLAPAQGRCRWG